MDEQRQMEDSAGQAGFIVGVIVSSLLWWLGG